uniref:Adenosine transporter 1r n=1 Tax=Trypanosoma brucei TaxID=5691 RepID=Q9Y0H9_9TRYP|nr:adenosine transporter 1r [Trypanosoma brucei]
MLGFDSANEFIVYVTFLFFGMSVVVVTNSIFSMPFFFIEYYKYAQGKPDAKPEDPKFWKHMFTYYSIAAFVVELVLASLMLTPIGRRISVTVRLGVGLVIPIVLVFSVMMVTIVTTTETGAKVTIMLIAIANGVAMTLCDAGNAALIAPFPTKFYSSVVWGIAVCGVVTSFFSIVIKTSMEGGYHNMLIQSRIYFGLVMFMQVISCALLVLLRKNPYAQKYAAEFRYAARKGIDDKGAGGDEGNGAAKGPADQDDDPHGGDDTDKGNVMTATVDPDTMKDMDQVESITTSQQMLMARVWNVFWRVWPMLFACFMVFFTTFLVYPAVYFAIKADTGDGWYLTIAAALFNLGDFLSRLCLQFKALHVSPRWVLIGTFARMLPIIPLVLCVRSIITGPWLPYILVHAWGFTYGYYGGISQIYAPRTGSLTTAGERSLAANWTIISLLGGIFVGAMFALAVNEGLPK